MNVKKLVREKFGEEKAEEIEGAYLKRFDEICRENPNESKAVREHTVKQVYPMVAYYDAMKQCGVEKAEAYAVLHRAQEIDAEKDAASMRMTLKIPGAYKLMPAMWKIVTKKMFGEAAGFRFSFYPVGKKRVKFDMTACPYCEVCKKYGCPELVTIFCDTDDVKNGDLHEKLLWNRSKTMGAGADCCDFDLIVKD